jgi:GNAT superfamily N-acetyltransferase
MYPDVDPSYEEDLRNIDRVYLTPGSHFWVAEAGAQLIGMVAIERIDADTGRLRRMRVTGDWRRRGIATNLLRTTGEFCRNAGYQRIILDTTKDQVAAHALYEKHGFVRTGSRRIGVVPVYDYVKAFTKAESVRIRIYEPRDQNVVWELAEEGLRDTGTLVGEYRRDLHPDLSEIEQWYMQAGGGFWIAEAEDRQIGMVGIERVDEMIAKLRQMRVTAKWRKQGVGRLLLETAEGFCRDNGYHRLILDTNALQTDAHRLYEAAGFTRTGERTIGTRRVFDYSKELR